MVNAADNQVRRSFFQDIIFGNLDAVGGSSRALVSLNALSKNIGLINLERVIDGDRVSHARLGAVGGHNKDLAQSFHAFHQVVNAVGSNAIIVRNYN